MTGLSVAHRTALSQIVDVCGDAALAQLMALCLADLSNGGRGIRNKVEAHLINPLARTLFDTGLAPGSKATIVAVNAGKITQLELRVTHREIKRRRGNLAFRALGQLGDFVESAEAQERQPVIHRVAGPIGVNHARLNRPRAPGRHRPPPVQAV